MVADAIATPPVPEKKASLIGENLNTPPSLIHIPPIPFSETVDFSLPASFSRECTPIRASSHLSTRPSSQICTAATSSASSIRTRMTNTSLIGDRGSRELRRPLRYR
ncbi:hypothetical protein Tcan_05991 [Toxocara canis]|nr:hypothetical protein Tcan_05991 [Toxocara canis]